MTPPDIVSESHFDDDCNLATDDYTLVDLPYFPVVIPDHLVDAEFHLQFIS